MKSIFRKAAVLALAGTMGAALLTGCGSTKVDGTQTVVTVNDEKLTLGVASFYSRFEQGQLYSYMAQMLGSSTNNFFRWCGGFLHRGHLWRDDEGFDHQGS
jgi:foldase protein PrsA